MDGLVVEYVEQDRGEFNFCATRLTVQPVFVTYICALNPDIKLRHDLHVRFILGATQAEF